MPSDCFNCEEIERAERGENPFAVARLTTGYVVLNKSGFYPGQAYFTAKRCVAELHELPPEERAVHLVEMSEVAAAIFHGFGARKMNYEALGNSVPHLHWWLTPRHHDDQQPKGPIWWSDWDTPERRLDDDRRDDFRRRLLDALRARAVTIEATFV
jgi:diadenosine tetraphosphate (Ap4A) HIT family hydrolase